MIVETLHTMMIDGQKIRSDRQIYVTIPATCEVLRKNMSGASAGVV